jgi:excisionase family DNA binding protein
MVLKRQILEIANIWQPWRYMKHFSPPDNLPLADEEAVPFRDRASSDTLKASQGDAAHNAQDDDQTRLPPTNALSQPNDDAMAGIRKATPSPAPLLDVQALCGILLVSRDTVYRLVARGELSSLRVGGKLRFRRADMEAYLDRSREAAARRDIYGREKD